MRVSPGTIAFLLATAISSNGFCASGDWIEKGRELLEKNEPKKALKYFEKAVVEWDLDKDGFGKLSEAERETAEALRRLGRLNKALERANAAVRHALYASNDGQLKLSLIVRSHIYLMFEDYEESVSDATNAIERLGDWEEENYRALELRAAALSGLRRFTKAIEDCFERLRIAKELRMPSQESAEVHFNMGDTYRQNQQYKRAIDAYGQAIEENPKSAIYYYARGTLYEDMGRRDMAKIDMAKAKEIDPAIRKKAKGKKGKRLLIWSE